MSQTGVESACRKHRAKSLSLSPLGMAPRRRGSEGVKPPFAQASATADCVRPSRPLTLMTRPVLRPRNIPDAVVISGPSSKRSLDGTCNSGKCVVCIRADQPYRADDKDEDDGQHHRVLGDVLTRKLASWFSESLIGWKLHTPGQAPEPPQAGTARLSAGKQIGAFRQWEGQGKARCNS